MGRLTESSVVAIKNKSHAVTAQIEVPEGGANGVIALPSGAFGGFALYVKDGRPASCYNLFGLQQFKVYGDAPIPAGEHQVRMEFAYDGGGRGKGGTFALFVDGEQVGEGRVEGTVPMLFSADETTDVGVPRRPWSATTTGRGKQVHGDGPLVEIDGRGCRGRRPPDRPGGAPRGLRWRASDRARSPPGPRGKCPFREVPDRAIRL